MDFNHHLLTWSTSIPVTNYSSPLISSPSQHLNLRFNSETSDHTSTDTNYPASNSEFASPFPQVADSSYVHGFLFVSVFLVNISLVRKWASPPPPFHITITSIMHFVRSSVFPSVDHGTLVHIPSVRVKKAKRLCRACLLAIVRRVRVR